MLEKEWLECVESWTEQNPKFYIGAGKFFREEKLHIDIGEPPVIIPFNDYLHQGWEGRKTDFFHIVMAGVIWQYILQGNIKYFVHETPPCLSDKAIEENSEIIKSYSTCVKDANIFDGDFWGGTQDEDGFVNFSKPPIKKRTYFPLEVGYCRSTQLFHHLVQSRCCARLPYGKEYIVYMEIVNDDLHHPCLGL